MWATGWNRSGQCGIPPSSPSASTSSSEPFLSTINGPQRIDLGEGVRVVSVACGEEHSLFVDDAGDAWACGSNGEGALGIAGTESVYQPTKVPSLTHSLFSYPCV